MVKTLAILSLLFLSLAGSPLSAQEEVVITNRSTTIQYIDGEQFYFHAVLQGQTLYSIARAYEVSQEDILLENPDIRDGLRYNQIIRIPVREETEKTQEVLSEDPPTDEGFVTHRVRRRETLFGLSRQYDVSIDDILHYNPETREGLKIGQLLRIPVVADYQETDESTFAVVDPIADDASEQPDAGDTDAGQNADAEMDYLIYDVVAGDTRFGISRKFGVSIEALDALNPGIAEGLNAGQQIIIPSGTSFGLVTPAEAERPYISISRPVEPQEAALTDEYCFSPELKDEYKVALLIPFYLEELIAEADSLNDEPGDLLPGHDHENLLSDPVRMAELRNNWLKDIGPDHPSFTFINYYHGVLLALDSIRQQGVNIRLVVEDVCQDVRKAQKVTEAPEFLDTDLIIGPFHRQSLDYVAGYGYRHGIPVVSPLLPDNRQLRGFPGLIKATPSLETMLDGVANYVSQTYPQQNIIIVHNQQPGAAPVIKAFQDTLLANLAISNYVYDNVNMLRVNGYYFNGTYVGGRRTNVPVMIDTVSVMVPVTGIEEQTISVPKPYNVQEMIYRYEGMPGLKKLLRKDRQNILITLISGEPFLSDYLRQLHAFRRDYDISIFGIPEWQDYRSIEIDYLQNLKVHFFVPDFYDYGDPHIRDLVLRYRKMFLTEPTNEAIKAAQTAYFFFNALAYFGTEFQRCFDLLNHDAIDNPYHFHQPFGAANGWENKHFYIYRIENYRRVDMNRPVKISDFQ